MSGYDTCPGCDGRKARVAQLCTNCTPRTGANGRNWRGGKPDCPGCGGEMSRGAKRCKKCPPSAFDDPDHLRGRDWQRAYRRTPNGQRYVRAMNLRKFNLTPEEYDAMLAAQGGVCAACGQAEETAPGGRVNSLSIDHDHICCPGQRSCGKCIRGLLCNRCNRALGLLRDSEATIESLLAYARRTAMVRAS